MHFKRAHYAPVNVNLVRVGSVGKGWGFEQKEKNFGQFPVGGEGYKHHIIIAKNPHLGAYTFHDECQKPD